MFFNSLLIEGCCVRVDHYQFDNRTWYIEIQSAIIFYFSWRKYLFWQ